MDDDNYDDYDAPAPSGALTHGISTKPVEAPPAAAPTYEEIEPAPKAAAPAAAAAQRTTGAPVASFRVIYFFRSGFAFYRIPNHHAMRMDANIILLNFTGGASTSQPVGAVESARSLVQRANREEGIDWYLNLSEDQLNRYECFKNTNLFPTGQAGAGAAGARGKKVRAHLVFSSQKKESVIQKALKLVNPFISSTQSVPIRRRFSR